MRSWKCLSTRVSPTGTLIAKASPGRLELDKPSFNCRLNVDANVPVRARGNFSRYFVDMVERLKNVKPEDLTENSVLLGSSTRIVEILKKVDAAGFDEVILYVNVGLKPHQQVKDEMARFMAEVAPAFASARKEAAA